MRQEAEDKPEQQAKQKTAENLDQQIESDPLADGYMQRTGTEAFHRLDRVSKCVRAAIQEKGHNKRKKAEQERQHKGRKKQDSKPFQGQDAPSLRTGPDQGKQTAAFVLEEGQYQH